MMQETILNNRYRLDAKIGEGGMALVYRGYDLMLRRQVAIKLLREQFAADDEFVERFYQEARAAARLSHPNIVNTYDVGVFEGTPYIVQEFVSGETLATLVAREGRLPEAAAVRYARQICAALVAAHRHELLHRDIKPSNILITPEDVVRVADFGIARAADAQTLSEPDAMLGSVPYCAPEQVSGGELSESTDLYSVGVVLYEMVTGRRPFEGDTAVAIAMAHLNAPVPDPSAVAGVHISPELRAVIRRMLQKAPRDRFQTAGEALAALRNCAGEEGGKAVETVAAGPDSPTVLLKRRAAAGSGIATARGGDIFDGVARWRPGRVVGVASFIVAAAVILALIFAQVQAASHSISVPDLAGKPVTDAVIQLQTLGFDVAGVHPREDTTTALGLVDGTDPAAGTRIGRGEKVAVYVSSGPPLVTMPNVVGQDVRVAMDLLLAAGFVPKLGAAVHSDSVKTGEVAQTRPAPGSQVAQHANVVLNPSSGPSFISVPNVVSLLDSDAQKLLAKLGLKMRVTQVIADASIPPHTIIDQDPAEGSHVRPGTTVVVDVSGGAEEVTVPSVVGGTVDDARNVLAQAGLALGAVAQAAVPDTSPGTVVGQNPPAGTPVGRGTPVDIVVAVSPGVPVPQVTAQPPATNAPPENQNPRDRTSAQNVARGRSPLTWRSKIATESH
jgi:eukaryotic-like serine/threonine-protein kinase